KNIDGEIVKKTIDRTKYILVQTPQIFERKLLEEVYNSLDLNNVHITDDAPLFEQQGQKVTWINGLEENIKITTPADLELAEFYYNKFYKKD
ncbi:MAG: 2-C-methyl-D-erythritol 4-phosphate cytidylyltransferase, partial [Calditrichia bacterium]|nr:2-C-methyl-D-erythritol 4-phosphate cytidylyltransferase [Calditrichia bacterium]